MFVHEFGHFWVAKKSGMRVLEFGFGFPPRLFGFQKVNGKWRIVIGHRDTTPAAEAAATPPILGGDDTIYSINAIPLGGFVKIWGENNEFHSDPESFVNKPFWPRFFTLIAGVAMNVVLAWVILSLGFAMGLPTAIDSPENLPKGAILKDLQVGIVEVNSNSPAESAGLQSGDIILSVDSVKAENIEVIHNYVTANAGKTFIFEIKRIDKIETINVSSKATRIEGEGPTGIALTNVGKLSFPWYRAFWEGAKSTRYALEQIVSGLYNLIVSGEGFKSLGGPVKIAQVTGQVADLGFVYVMQFAAFLSLNLAVLNIMPFPALDGGRVLFLIIEKLRGKRNNAKIEQVVNAVGFVFLILLMVLVTIKDVRGFWN